MSPMKMFGRSPDYRRSTVFQTRASKCVTIGFVDASSRINLSVPLEPGRGIFNSRECHALNL